MIRKLSLILSTVLFLLPAGCGQNNAPRSAIIKPAHFTTEFPKTSDIQSVSIASDGAGSMWMVPNDPTKTTLQIVDWLQTAKPVNVQVSQSKSKKQWATSAYTGPSMLYLHLKNKEIIEIAPANYIWVTNSGFEYHYLNGFIKYDVGGKAMYFQDPELYKWLKQDQWKGQFHA